MERHFILFDDDTAKNSRFDETDLGTDLNEAIKRADKFANYLTVKELNDRLEYKLIACDVPADFNTDEIIWCDYVVEVVKDYKENERR